jgi:hypothetical protein
MSKIRRILPWLALSLILTVASTAMACPNCKEALADQDGDAMRLANGYSWSIILMISTPLALLGTGVMAVTRAARRGALPEM